MNQVYQDLQQIRTICQQLAQNERLNAQIFSQQPGMQGMAQREQMAALQLQQCINLCDRVEQTVAQRTQQATALLSGGFGGQSFGGQTFGGQNVGFNNLAFREILNQGQGFAAQGTSFLGR